jgi:hypothetical protein
MGMRRIEINKGLEKIRLCFVIMMLSLIAGTTFSQKIYYIDSQSGNDLNTGTAENSAWKTIDKLNNSMSVIKPSDIIRFKRGGVYEGQINLTVSGTAGQPIVIEAYGTGDNPVISGTKMISSWRKYNGNIYRASVPKNALNAFVNGNQLVVARAPNIGNYFRIGTGGTNNFFSDPVLTQASNSWNVAKCRIRTIDYTWEISTVSSFANQAVTLQANTNFTLQANQTYYFDNTLAALDTVNEWFSSGGLLYVYFSNLSDTSHVYASLYDYGILSTSGAMWPSVTSASLNKALTAFFLLPVPTLRSPTTHLQILWAGQLGSTVPVTSPSNQIPWKTAAVTASQVSRYQIPTFSLTVSKTLGWFQVMEP